MGKAVGRQKKIEGGVGGREGRNRKSMISISECCRRLSVQGVLSYSELMRLSLRVSLPWCGEGVGCMGLLYNGGLYTQCGSSESSSSYCSKCEERKSSGKWLGSVSDRKLCKIGEYSVGGKREVSYLKVMSKSGISRSMAEHEASSRGLSIPLEHFEERVESVSVSVGKRGRPRKVEKKDSALDVVEQADEEKKESALDPIETEKKESDLDPVETEKKESDLDPVETEKNESDLDPVETEKNESALDPVREPADSEPSDKEKKPVEKEKKKRGRPRKEKSVSSNNEGEDLIASLLNERKEEVVCPPVPEEEEETLVIKIEIEGKMYLKSEDNTLYDFMSHDEIGMWNETEGFRPLATV